MSPADSEIQIFLLKSAPPYINLTKKLFEKYKSGLFLELIFMVYYENNHEPENYMGIIVNQHTSS